MTPVELKEFAMVLDKNIKRILENYLNPAKMVSATLLGRETTNTLVDEYATIGSVGDIPKFSGKVTYLGISPGFRTQIENQEFAGGIMIERRLLDTAQHKVMRDLQGRLASSLQRTKEKHAANMFNYAFTAAWQFMSNDEGVAWCGNHTTKSGVPTTTGFSNAGSSALSKTAVQATRLAMLKFKDDVGEFFDCQPDLLIVPYSLYDQACEIVGYDPRSGAASELDPTSANHNINVLYKAFKVVPWIYLDQFSPSNWFMADSRYLKEFALWIDRINAEHHTIPDYETFVIKQIVYSAFGCGWIEWRCIFGHNVA